MIKCEAVSGSLAPGKAGAASFQPQRVDSSALLGAWRELIIVHHGREYRLRLTQNEKLILTA